MSGRNKKSPAISVSYSDLEDAYHWIDAAPGENTAHISKETGGIYFGSESYDVVEELPDDIGDPDLYWAVPDRLELGLGNELAFEFVERQTPQHYDELQEIFQRRGAYERFKNLLSRNGLLDRWYEYENSKTETSLRAWAESEGIRVVDNEPTAGPQRLEDE